MGWVRDEKNDTFVIELAYSTSAMGVIGDLVTIPKKNIQVMSEEYDEGISSPSAPDSFFANGTHIFLGWGDGLFITGEIIEKTKNKTYKFKAWGPDDPDPIIAEEKSDMMISTNKPWKKINIELNTISTGNLRSTYHEIGAFVMVNSQNKYAKCRIVGNNNDGTYIVEYIGDSNEIEKDSIFMESNTTHTISSSDIYTICDTESGLIVNTRIFFMIQYNHRATHPFTVGDRVEGAYEGGPGWYPGAVSAANADGTFAITYDDGDTEAEVAAIYLKHELGDDMYPYCLGRIIAINNDNTIDVDVDEGPWSEDETTTLYHNQDVDSGHIICTGELSTMEIVDKIENDQIVDPLELSEQSTEPLSIGVGDIVIYMDKDKEESALYGPYYREGEIVAVNENTYDIEPIPVPDFNDEIVTDIAVVDISFINSIMRDGLPEEAKKSFLKDPNYSTTGFISFNEDGTLEEEFFTPLHPCTIEGINFDQSWKIKLMFGSENEEYRFASTEQILFATMPESSPRRAGEMKKRKMGSTRSMRKGVRGVMKISSSLPELPDKIDFLKGKARILKTAATIKSSSTKPIDETINTSIPGKYLPYTVNLVQL